MLFLFLQNEENWSFDDEPFKQLRYKARDLIFRKKKKKKKNCLGFWLVSTGQFFTSRSSSLSHKVQFWDEVCVYLYGP